VQYYNISGAKEITSGREFVGKVSRTAQKKY
jgi:hypothetical protein